MEKNLINNKEILKLIEKYKSIWSLNHFVALGNWDLNTYIPKDGVASRSLAMSKLAVLSQELFLDKDFIALIESSKKQPGLNEYERAILRSLNRTLKYYQKLPPEFIEEFTRLTNESQMVWSIARINNDFSSFEPYLEKIVEMSRKKAEYLGFEKSPYDALLDEFEEGLTVKDVEDFFNKLKPRLISLLSYIKSSKRFQSFHPLEKLEYDINNMQSLNKKILDFVHYNKDNIRLDISAHPFSTTMGKGDARITTRYEGKDFEKSYGSTIHEYGHALYEMQSHEDLFFTPIAGGTSLVIHESQSRFWENFIGKSKEFINHLYSDLILINPEIKNYSIEDIYDYFNIVKPGLIRTDADEVTYHFHIMVRFEIERDLIEGKIEVKDLPEVWKKKYIEYLGVEPNEDKDGVMQDIHWSEGLFGYFPTYSLGTALGAMFKYHLEKDLGKLSVLLESKDGIRKIQDWLRLHIHQYGSTFLFKELSEKSLGEEFDPEYLLDYLEDKYKRIY